MTETGGFLEITTSPAAEHDLLVLDLDGVVYQGAAPVPHAVASLRQARSAGCRWSFATNNASRTPEAVASHLRELGLEVDADQVVTSAQAGAALAVDLVGRGARVLAVGGPGVVAACLDAGLEPVAGPEHVPAVVVQGYGPAVSWDDLAGAVAAIRDGAAWVATNTDLTIPTDRGVMPGNGALVGVVRTVVDHDPEVAGKPRPGLFTVAVRRVGARRPLVVGDRLDTDMAGARAAGQPGMVVLTGVTGWADLLQAPRECRPQLVAADLRGLLVAHLAPARSAAGWTCGGAQARYHAGRVTGSAPVGHAAALDLLRAACTAAWEAADADLAPGPPEVDPGLAGRWDALVSSST